MSNPDTRAERLEEVSRLSRKPMQQLHAGLLDVVLTAMDRMEPDDWLNLVRKAPDRVIGQMLACTARMAGFGDKLEHELSGQLDHAHRLMNMTDAELYATAAQDFKRSAPWVWDDVVAALPPALAQQLRTLPDDVKEQIYTIMAQSFAGPRLAHREHE